MSETSLNNYVLALLTTRENKEKFAGGAPHFIVEDEEELEQVGMLLARLTLGMVHDLGNGVRVIIKH